MAEIDEMKKVERVFQERANGPMFKLGLFSVLYRRQHYVKAEDYDRVIAALEESQKALAEMTVDRNWWQEEAHGGELS